MISRPTRILVDHDHFYVFKIEDLSTQLLLAQSFAQLKRPPKVYS